MFSKISLEQAIQQFNPDKLTIMERMEEIEKMVEDLKKLRDEPIPHAKPFTSVTSL